MNKEELIQRYFDGNLSSVESKQFEKLLDSNPSFKSEINAHINLNKHLEKSSYKLSNDDIRFVKQIEKNLLEKGCTEKGFMSRFKPSFLNISLIAIVLIVVSAIVFNSFITSETDNKDQNINNSLNIRSEIKKQDLHEEDIKYSQETDENSNIKSIENDANKQIQESDIEKVNANNQIPNELNSETGNSKDGSIYGEIIEENKIKNSEILNGLEQELKEYTKANNRQMIILTLKRLGVLYAQMNDVDTGLDKLEQAYSLYMSSGNNILNADILGEISLIYSRSGNKTKADDYRQKCLDLLIDEPENLSKWMKRFNK